MVHLRIFIVNKNLPYQIAASILSADLAYLADDCKEVLYAGVHALHIDVMDFHYVPNLTFGAHVVAALQKANIKTFYDVHLMVDTPENYIEPFCKAGADCITFHPLTTQQPLHLLKQIQDKGMKAGLAFNPNESIDMNDQLLKHCDMILIMSVYPGFGGQTFISDVLNKIPPLLERCKKLNINPIIAMDGGINLATIKTQGPTRF